MDAHKQAGGGGEVRRINVVYFLSRGGRTDHPHLFRVNHLNRAGGVRLRDVKRWLSELRGKDMPGNYSWSYKRKYKAGYVWQDLKEDDLITPISDNEYVLKGCDVRGTPPPCVQVPKRTHSTGEKKQKEVTPCNDDQNRPVEVVLTQDSDESSPKPPPDSPGGCESARLSATAAAPFKAEKQQQGLHEQKQKQKRQGQEHDVVIKIEVSRSSQDHHRHQETQTRQQQEEEEEASAEDADAKAVARAAPAEHQPQGAGGVGPRHAVGPQARRMRVARALHNILTCGAADADDAALRPVARRQGRSAAEAGPGDDWPPTTPTCPGMDGCGLRVSRKPRSRRGGSKDKPGKRDGAARDAYKPATLPRCSQCGKEFKPQELHAHMQSCRGFKERMRSSTSSGADRRRNSAAGRRSKRDHYSPERSSSASAVFLLTES